MHLNKFSLLLVLALLLPACSEKPPVPEEKFVDFYINLQLLDARYGNDAALQKTKADSLMKAFSISHEILDSTMAWYGKRPDRWQEFFTEVNRRLERMKPEYVRKKPR